MRKLSLLILSLFLFVATLQAQEDGFLKSMKIQGTLRAKYEYQPQPNESRFQVRNARVSVSGKLYPLVNYKAEIDLNDEGKIKMLDAYGQITPLEDFRVTLGQMRVPFTIDAHRSPHTQYFANRSFIAKQVGNIRDVGGMVGVDLLDTPFPIIADAAIFNGSGLTNQKEWHSSMNYSARVQLFPFAGANLTLSGQTIKPEDVRITMLDVGANYAFHRFHIEGELLHKSYSDHMFKEVTAWNAFVNYDLPLKSFFEKVSFLLRYDGMTDHSSGIKNEEGELVTDDHARNRLTTGVTFSFGEAFTADIRLNYEKYFYASGAVAKESEQDKLVLELMVRF